MKKSVLREYAKLIVQMGANVQKGQDVVIQAGLDQPEFVQMVVEAAYKAKARKVTVDWHYQPLSKVNVRYQSLKTLGTVEDWQKARYDHYGETLPCRIILLSDDPDGLKGMNITKLNKANQMIYPIVRAYREKIDGNHQWTAAAVPGVAWAKKMFPGLRASAAVEKQWEAILHAARVTDDAIQSWKDHNADLEARCAYLNGLGIQKLHLTADNGTDLTVGMIPEAVFIGGGETTRQGVFFNPNSCPQSFTALSQGS